MYVHEITEGEKACGVTMEDVKRVRRLGAFSGDTFYVPAGTGPALGASAARAAFGAPATFSHISKVTGFVAYVRD